MHRIVIGRTNRALTRCLCGTAKDSRVSSGISGTWNLEGQLERKSNNSKSDSQMQENNADSHSNIKGKIKDAAFAAEEKIQDAVFATKETVVNTIVY